MGAIKLTSKRQATLPKALCDEMGVRPGDVIQLETGTVKGERVWYLKPAAPELAWFGALRRYAKGRSHDMRSIRRSIAKGRASGRK